MLPVCADNQHNQHLKYFFIEYKIYFFIQKIPNTSHKNFLFSGVDVISLMESIGISDKLLTPLKESHAGYFALALALYKLVTPLRYAVTVGNILVDCNI